MIHTIYVVVKREKVTGAFVRVCASYRFLRNAEDAVNQLNSLSDCFTYSYVKSNFVSEEVE